MGTIAELFRYYRDGHLWNAGGVADQPALYLEMMKTISYWSDHLNA